MPGTSAVKNHLENICGYCGFEYGEDDIHFMKIRGCSAPNVHTGVMNHDNDFFCAKCE